MKARLIGTFILSSLDLVFTLYLQKRFGDIEANPIGKLLLKNIVIVVGYKVFIIGALLLILYKWQTTTVAVVGSWIILTVYVLLTLYHVTIIGCVHHILFVK